MISVSENSTLRDLLTSLAFAVVCLLIVTAKANGGKYNREIEIGQQAPAWENLQGVDGKTHSLADYKKDYVVVVFTCNTCDYSKAYESRLNRFAEQYQATTDVIAINVNKSEDENLTAMKKHAEDNQWKVPYLWDPTQQVAKDYGATWTPEFFVLNKQRQIVYMGALDDNDDPERVTKKYVEVAIASLLRQSSPEIQETPAVGCLIKYERNLRKRRPRTTKAE